MVFSPIKLVRRSVEGIKDYCKWQKSASPQPRLLVDVAGFIYGPDGRGLQSINLTSRAALCARRAGVRVISVSVSAHAFPRGPALSKFSRMLSLFSRVFARDPNEKAKLLSVLDRRSTVPDLIRVVPDTACGCLSSTARQGREIFYVKVEYSSTSRSQGSDLTAGFSLPGRPAFIIRVLRLPYWRSWHVLVVVRWSSSLTSAAALGRWKRTTVFGPSTTHASTVYSAQPI